MPCSQVRAVVLSICSLFLTSQIFFLFVDAAAVFYVVQSESEIKSFGNQSFPRESLANCFVSKHIRKL